MQLTAILVAALSASTLTSALPTDLNSTDPSAYNEEAEHGLQKRDTFGWISSFQGSGKLLIHQTIHHPKSSILTHV